MEDEGEAAGPVETKPQQSGPLRKPATGNRIRVEDINKEKSLKGMREGDPSRFMDPEDEASQSFSPYQPACEVI